MLTKKNLLNLTLVAMSSVLVIVIAFAINEKEYDISNEITILSRSIPGNPERYEGKKYTIQPAFYKGDYSQDSYQEKGVKNKVSNYLDSKFLHATQTTVVASNFYKSQVSITIIRRELTDSENGYMVAELMLICNGGLPLGALSNLEQFFDGTYFPPLYVSNPRNTKAPSGFISPVCISNKDN